MVLETQKEDHETWFSIESVPFLSCSHQVPLKKLYIYTYFRGGSPDKWRQSLGDFKQRTQL